FHATTLAGTRLVIAFVLLIFLVGAALWIGRPLLKMAFRNFRHFHYSLIFPIFVAVREVLRTIIEILGGHSKTAQQLDRRRRFATVLAALLFAGGGLALAIAIDFRIGLTLVNVEQVRPWPVFKAALSNAAVVFGLSTAFESLFWL